VDSCRPPTTLKTPQSDIESFKSKNGSRVVHAAAVRTAGILAGDATSDDGAAQ
jgi:hypothetical protein